jgi:hypothetical protein
MNIMIRIPVGEGRDQCGVGKGWVVLRSGPEGGYPVVMCFCFDKDEAKTLHALLHEAGTPVWLDEATIEGG